jgi:hypothetical protein
MYIDENLSYHSVTKSFKDLQLFVSIVSHDNGTRISRIVLEESSNNATFDLTLDESGKLSKLDIDGTPMFGSLGRWDLSIARGSILPDINISSLDKPQAGEAPATGDTFRVGRDLIAKFVAPELDKRITEDTLARLVDQLRAIGLVTKEALRNAAERTRNRSWAKLLRDIGGQDRNHMYDRLRLLILIGMLPEILGAVCSDLRRTIVAALYIGPARAKSDRYYRYQDLSVSEIDPDGKNFPMFLNSMSHSQIQAFSDWVNELFGYGVKVRRESGHVTINLVYETSEVNVVDTGYGISQILPVLGQVWWANNRQPTFQSRYGVSRYSQIIAIEQPELHLHPAHQALLADAFVGSLHQSRGGHGRSRPDLRFLIETHSETMINRLGQLISEKKVSAQDVQIVIFSADSAGARKTDVRVANFDDDGQLINWPYGFFMPVR